MPFTEYLRERSPMQPRREPYSPKILTVGVRTLATTVPSDGQARVENQGGDLDPGHPLTIFFSEPLSPITNATLRNPPPMTRFDGAQRSSAHGALEVKQARCLDAAHPLAKLRLGLLFACRKSPWPGAACRACVSVCSFHFQFDTVLDPILSRR